MAGLPAVVAAVLPCGPRHAGLKLSDVLHRLSLPYTALQRSWMLAALALRAIGEHVQRLRQLGVAVLFHEPCAAVAAGAAARFALDREGRDAKIRERVRVVSHFAVRRRIVRARF